eukprot:scaffold89639_cov75-Phaeocystis_antarctica.AAC.2
MYAASDSESAGATCRELEVQGIKDQTACAGRAPACGPVCRGLAPCGHARLGAAHRRRAQRRGPTWVPG